MFNDDVIIDLAIRSLILGPIGLLWVIIIVRNIGLRTFSKMTAFDFISTVATGSLLANVATSTDWKQFIQACGGLLFILVTQFVLAKLRRKSQKISNILENEPVLLVSEGKWNKDVMDKVRVSDSDLWAKLREANVTDLKKIRAVVLETTGDISVLHDDSLNDKLLTGVQIKIDNIGKT